ncbi:MAG: glycoside hydrolase family 3 N-terminal domain-containing protein [Pseudomonadota bacterium]
MNDGSSSSRALIVGLQGPALSADEAAFLRDATPWGLIVFARNVETPGRLKALVADAREALGWEAPVLIDQEGGRVARLRTPYWLAWPTVGDTVATLGPNAAAEALTLRYRLIAHELRDLGIDVDCMPLLDVPVEGAHDVIGQRAFARDPALVAMLGKAVSAALLSRGVLPVIKHLPGHGRAGVDSHHALPRVDADRRTLDATDFAAFRAYGDEVLGMTAHIIYEALDPDRCATLSPPCIELIRAELGFRGLLMTDDISMGALDGPIARRGADALAAGCDMVLHCNGDSAEMGALAEVTPILTGEALARARRAIAARAAAVAAMGAFDHDAALRQYQALTKGMDAA